MGARVQTAASLCGSRLSMYRCRGDLRDFRKNEHIVFEKVFLAGALPRGRDQLLAIYLRRYRYPFSTFATVWMCICACMALQWGR